MKNAVYEKHINNLEMENTVLRNEIKQLQSQLGNAEKKALIEKGEVLKGVVLFLNTTYGRLGEIQASLLNKLNVLNNANLVTTNERMAEALKMVNKLLPLEVTESLEA